jgi:hypothetical protein
VKIPEAEMIKQRVWQQMSRWIGGIGVILWWLGMKGPVLAQEWQEIQGKHFVVHYADKDDQESAKKLLSKAERYYNTIGARLGYTRYAKFWTWDERVKIILFPDQKSFVLSTGQPLWATGYTDRDAYLLNARSIVTYKQEHAFYDGLLPHEISHLILHDFIQRKEAIPLWFDEGVAQLAEEHKSEVARQIMFILVGREQHIPIETLMVWDIRQEKDPHKVKIFYAQSLSMVEFLVDHYGNAAFSRLCRNLRDGKPFAESLQNAYSNQINSLMDFQDKWKRSVMAK